MADTYSGWKGSLGEEVAEQRLGACLRDSELSPQEFVSAYLPGMFSENPRQEVKDELGKVMSDFHPLGFRLMATALARGDTRELLPEIKVPTLLIWGDADKRSPLSVGHQMRDAIPGSRFEVIAGVGHVSNLENPHRFNEIVLDFIATIG